MPMYAYKGIGADGKAVTGVRDADSPKALRQLLRKDGVLVTEHELSKGGKAAARRRRRRKGLSREVDLGGLSAASRRPRSRRSPASWPRCCARASRSPRRSARCSSRPTTSASRCRSARSAPRSTRAARSADALAKHPKIFDELYVSMVRAGETAGNLDEVLTRLADFLDGAQKLKSQGPGRDDLPDHHGRRHRHHGRPDGRGRSPRSPRCSRRRARRCRSTRAADLDSGFVGSYWFIAASSALVLSASAGRGRRAASRPGTASCSSCR